MKPGDGLHNRLINLSVRGEGSVPKVPLVEIIADRRVLIENHLGVCKYAREHICVKTSLGIIQIKGKGLFLDKMSRERLTIIGQITDVLVFRRNLNVD